MTHQTFEDAAKVKYPDADNDFFFQIDVELQREAYIAGLEKCLPLVEALRMIEKHCISGEDPEGACFAIKNIVFNAIESFPLNESKPNQ